MLQRIQSIFLLLASGSFFALFGVDFASSSKPSEGLFSDQLYNVLDNPILIGLTALGGVIALISIFLFKNRPLQLRLGYILIIISILLALVAGLLVFNEQSELAPNTTIDDGLGIYLPLIALIGAILANRYIKKDSKLVKSMDRLR